MKLSSNLRPTPSAGFSLIELLTVISIIAVLAALTVGLTAAAKNARVNSRAQAELRQLEAAIEAYKSDRNAYPPDHVLPAAAGQPRRVDPTLNPLYYELVGTEVVGGRFRVKGTSDSLSPAEIRQAFGRSGFLNVSVNPDEPAQTYLSPKASGVRRVTVAGGGEVELLVTPFDWPLNATEPVPVAGSRANPWRYVSTGPTNNVGGFDLWAEVMVGKEKRVFSNW
ncbi:MAG: type II secretion system protein [Verrucomicrobiae bacterium]|nr:type II secretion system protein [Verrucomicrobiae bacterium]